MDNKRRIVATKTLLVLSCAFLLGLTSCSKKNPQSSDVSSNTPVSETTSEQPSSDVTTSEGTTSDVATSEDPSSDVTTSEDTSLEDPSSDVSSEDTSSEDTSSEEVLLDFAENVKLNDKTVTYNGEEQTLTVENLPAGALVTYEGTHKYTNAGQYTISATVSKDGYNDKVVSAKLTIAKAKVEVPTAKTNLVYTGEAIVGVDSHNLYTVSGGSAVDAGNHEATVTLKDADNYEWASEFDGKVSYTIAQAGIDVSGVTAPEMSVVDTGNAISFIVNGLPNNVKATVTYYSDEAMTTPVSEAKNVGVYFVKVELASTSENHVLEGTTTLTSKLTIKENITGVTFAGATFTYDGTEKAIAVDKTNAKPDGNFEVTYFLNEECTTSFTSLKNAGTYTVYAKVVDKNEVYSTTVLQATLTINKVAVKVVVQNKEITYNQDAPKFAYEVEGLVNGESAENVIKGNATFTCGYVKGSNIGTYDITLSGLTADNYELVYYKGTLTVEKATYDLSEVTVKEETTVKYDGTSKEVVVSGVPAGVSYNVTYYSDEGHNNPVSECKNAGTYYVVVTLTSSDSDTNYNKVDVTKNVTLVIEQKTLYVNWSGANEIAYDGKDKEDLLSCEVVTNSVVPGENVSVEVILDNIDGNKVVGEVVPNKVGQYEYILQIKGDTASNYIISEKYQSRVLEIVAPTHLSSVESPIGNKLSGTFALGVKAKDDKYYFIPNTKSGRLTVNDLVGYSSISSANLLSNDVWTITPVDGKTDEYYIHSGENYLSAAANSNEFKFAESQSACTWKIVVDPYNEDNYVIQAVIDSITDSSKNRYMYYNPNGTNEKSYIGTYYKDSKYATISLFSVTTEEEKTLSINTENDDGQISYVSSTGSLEGLYSIDNVTLTIKPNAGKRLESLTLQTAEGSIPLIAVSNEEGTEYTYVLTPTVSGTITATFGEAKQKYNVEVTPNPLVNGTISNINPQVMEGDTVLFTVEADSDYYVKSVSVTPSDSSTPFEVKHTGNDYSFIMPGCNVEISVEIALKPKVTIVQDHATITVTIDDGNVASDDLVVGGTVVTINATSKPGYVLEGITVNGALIEGTTYTVDSDVIISAKVTEVTYTEELFTTINDVVKMTTETISENRYFVKGKVTSVTYNASFNNYEIDITDDTKSIKVFRGLLKEKEGVVAPVVGDTIVVYGYSILYKGTYELSGDETHDYPVILNTIHNSYSITTTIVDGEGKPSENATISGLPESGKANSGDKVEFTVNPSSGYKVGNVKVNDENIAAVAGTYSFIVSKAMSIEIVVVSESTKVVSTIWSTDFSDSNRDTSTQNNYTISHEYVTAKDTKKEVTWSLKCGSSGGGADMILSGENCLIRARMAKNKTNPSATITSSALTLNSYIESFTFSYTLKNKTTLKVSYSLDGGTTWIEGKTYNNAVSSLTSDTIEIKEETTSGLCVKFEFAYNGTVGSTNQDCDIDDVSVSGYSLL